MENKEQNNPWHKVSFGEEAPNVVNAIIEIPKGSKAKYELDKDSGMLKLDRVLFSSIHYPANYGFIPRTYCDDKDPLDILVICSIDVQPMCLINAKVIGVMQMIDNNEEDDKIIAVAYNDMSVRHINDISELPPHTLLEMRRFFEDYKKLENKEVIVEQFLGREHAYKIIQDSVDLYNTTFGELAKEKAL
ncbi:inorganic diphosphatase [Pontibacter silvestris]|uniref:Inorganic pyrophosphatase n=1 Tax=Pontibacter silvestris TaxID=2305183 RepID=A0ABW4X1A0_9BACT|nr:inorganic diphosphatase [Pontibacter silvestris]MCC9135865.1 inorganic diphosphatase [Pontibacter silvestris]